MKMDPVSIPFRENAIKALADGELRRAMSNSTAIFSENRARGFSKIDNLEELRERASQIRLQVLDNLTNYIDEFSNRATSAGSVVHRAHDAHQARKIILAILKDHGIKKIVKAKSMVSEEVHLNDYLEHHGMEVLETDLGEYIIQLAKERPSHILAPALHKNRRQVGELFAEKLGVQYTDDPDKLTKYARHALRQGFLEADAGISGANFGVARTGSVVLFTNEGNGRMVTTIPRLHLVIMSIEKLVPKPSDLAPFMRLLPRSATGQILSSYISLITGPGKPGEMNNPSHVRIVLLDNGRSEILDGPYREILKCIRCGACMNVCPVYGAVGGHAYGATYPGPMGIVLTNLLEGMERAHPLLDATTLCGACAQVCPVKVPLVQLLSELREERVREGMTPASEASAMAAFGRVVSSRRLFSMGQRFSRLFWPMARVTSAKQTVKRMPTPAKTPFHKRFD
jgi:L-lactate dehydrogenase complex protein LldF